MRAEWPDKVRSRPGKKIALTPGVPRLQRATAPAVEDTAFADALWQAQFYSMLASVFPTLKVFEQLADAAGSKLARLELWSRRSTSLGSRGSEFGFEELFNASQDFRPTLCFVDRLPERSATR